MSVIDPDFSRLQWNKDVYHRWNSIFGPLEENVADFYLSVTPDTYLKPMHGVIRNSLKTFHNNLNYYDQLYRSKLDALSSIGLDDKIADDKFNYFAQGMNLQSPLINGVNSASNALNRANSNLNNLKYQQQINMNNNIAGLLGAGAMILGRK